MGVGVLIQITPQLRILIAIDAIDGRKGIDSLAQLCREKLDSDPFSGCLFIFRSRSGKAIRILAYDGQGFRAMREYAAKRGWTIAVQIKEVGPGAAERELRENLLAAARRREIDVVLVWRLDRWGRSLVDLVVTLKELAELGVSFVSLSEALDLTTPTGRAMAGLLSVFAEFEHEILRERIRAGIAEARLKGKRFGRPLTAAKKTGEIRKLYRAGVSKAEIARRLDIGRTSVRRILANVKQ